MSSIKVGIVGLGKIARDQHLPALGANPAFELVAVASRNATLDGVVHFATLTEMLDGMPELDAVALCTPPTVRYGQARLALAWGRHVLLEKPPGATLSEVEDLTRRAEATGNTLFATWHSRHAPGVAPARAWLASRTIRRVDIQWKEDVRVWHPGQAWIWEPGGMGVFDPGINALSIVTAILPRTFFLREALLCVPENCQAPIAAKLTFTDADDTSITAELDFLQTGPPTWDIHIDTDAGRLSLCQGGSQLFIDGRLEHEAPEQEYPGLYARFAQLVAQQQSEVDVTPLRHVADAFMLGRREIVAAFHDA